MMKLFSSYRATATTALVLVLGLLGCQPVPGTGSGVPLTGAHQDQKFSTLQYYPGDEPSPEPTPTVRYHSFEGFRLGCNYPSTITIAGDEYIPTETYTLREESWDKVFYLSQQKYNTGAGNFHYYVLAIGSDNVYADYGWGVGSASGYTSDFKGTGWDKTPIDWNYGPYGQNSPQDSGYGFNDTAVAPCPTGTPTPLPELSDQVLFAPSDEAASQYQLQDLSTGVVTPVSRAILLAQAMEDPFARNATVTSLNVALFVYPPTGTAKWALTVNRVLFVAEERAALLALKSNAKKVGIQQAFTAATGIVLMGRYTDIRQERRDCGSANSIWLLNKFERGWIIEKLLGQNLCQPFPVIDIWNGATGTATSIKSMNLMNATYKNPSKMRYTLRGYVQELYKFRGKTMCDEDIRDSQIKNKILLLAIPCIPDPVQRVVLEDTRLYAQSLGIRFWYRVV